MNFIQNIFGLLGFFLLCVSCSKTNDYIETNYHRLDLSGIEDKSFTKFKNANYSNHFTRGNFITLKSSCDSMLVYYYSTSDNIFFQVSDSLNFPKLFVEDNSFLFYFMGRLLPMRSDFINNELKSVFFINEYWYDADYSGLWIVLSNANSTSNFIVLENLGNMGINRRWEKAEMLLVKLNLD